jgi:uncharacterized protein (DUF2249 family)
MALPHLMAEEETLYRVAAEHPGEFTWDCTESGPEPWRVRIGRP